MAEGHPPPPAAEGPLLGAGGSGVGGCRCAERVWSAWPVVEHGLVAGGCGAPVRRDCQD